MPEVPAVAAGSEVRPDVPVGTGAAVEAAVSGAAAVAGSLAVADDAVAVDDDVDGVDVLDHLAMMGVRGLAVHTVVRRLRL